MYIGNEFVPMPLLLILALMILTAILTRWGERAQYRTEISTSRRFAIQLAAIVPLIGAGGLTVAFGIVNLPS